MAEARIAWERLDAACGGLLARRCKSHAPYMGCPLDCGDVENALTPEFEQARPLITAAFGEIDALRKERHWADCATNHGGAECDMGPECGLRPETRAELLTLTAQRDAALRDLERVRAELGASVRRERQALEALARSDRAVERIGKALGWDDTRSDVNLDEHATCVAEKRDNLQGLLSRALDIGERVVGDCQILPSTDSVDLAAIRKDGQL